MPVVRRCVLMKVTTAVQVAAIEVRVLGGDYVTTTCLDYQILPLWLLIVAKCFAIFGPPHWSSDLKKSADPHGTCERWRANLTQRLPSVCPLGTVWGHGCSALSRNFPVNWSSWVRSHLKTSGGTLIANDRSCGLPIFREPVTTPYPRQGDSDEPSLSLPVCSSFQTHNFDRESHVRGLAYVVCRCAGKCKKKFYFIN